MRQASVDIHGILHLEASGEDFLVKKVERELQDHLIQDKFPGEPDLYVRFGPFDAPSSSNLAIEKNMIFARESFRGARWQVKVEGFEEEKLRMSFQGNSLSRMIAVKRVVEPAFRYIMDKKGYPMVHSACLVKDGLGVLVSAGGGGGKTTLLLRWLEDGSPFFSDDYTIVSSGKALSYVTPLRIGLRNLLESPSLRRIPLHDQAEIVMRTAARYFFLKKVRLAYKAPAKKLFPDAELVSEAELLAVVVIRSTAREFSLQAVSPDEMAANLAAVNREEMYRFAPYLEAYGGKFPDSPAAGFFEAHRERLKSAIGSLPCFKLYMPQRWTDDTWKKFKDELFSDNIPAR